MTFPCLILLAAIASCSMTAPAQQASSPAADSLALSASARAEDETPAQARIDAAKKQIAEDPKKVQAFNDLADAYTRRARETDDSKYLRDADSALAQGFRLSSDDFQLEKAQVSLMLAKGDFAQANAKATELNRRTLDDVTIYGYLADAEIGLGDYASAATNAQWMLNMLPNNVPGLMIGAKLRTHAGDTNGAIELLNLAYAETSPAEIEELAWIANQIASIEIDAGKIDAAIAMLNQAEETFPHYPYTAANLARARHAQSSAPISPVTPAAKSDASGQRIENDFAPKDAADEADRAVHEVSSAKIEFAEVPASLLTPRPSETDRVIKRAQAMAAQNPKNAKAFATLGAAYFQRARETGDVSDYEMAEGALKKSLDLDSSDFSAGAALETAAEVCMGEHRFADALTYSEKALALGSGDLSPFATIGDAYADMGEYEKARVAYERLTPVGAEISPRVAYARDSRLAYLSFVHGDTRDAIRLMQSSVTEGTEAAIPSENLAWLHFELGEFEALAGDAQAADEAYRAALKIHPGDYRAMASMARLRANYGRYEDAILLYQKAIAVVPMPVFIAELGDVYAKTSQPAEAKKEYDLVEYIGLLGHVNQVLHNRDLATFYADHGAKTGEAVELARKEFEVRHDIYTWDALAWALYKEGQFAEAAKASGEALRFGTRDALLHFHAGMIAAKLGRTDKTKSELTAAIEINPLFNVAYAPEAARELAALGEGMSAQESAANHAR